MPKSSLTVKRRRFIEGVAQGKKKSVAYVEAGYKSSAPNVASTEASRLLKIPAVQRALERAYKRHGIDIDSIIAPVGKALKAKLKVPIEGDFYETEIDDLDMQLKGHDRAAKLMGLYPARQEATTTIWNFGQISGELKDKYEAGE